MLAAGEHVDAPLCVGRGRVPSEHEAGEAAIRDQQHGYAQTRRGRRPRKERSDGIAKPQASVRPAIRDKQTDSRVVCTNGVVPQRAIRESPLRASEISANSTTIQKLVGAL